MNNIANDELEQLKSEVERWTNNCAEAHLKLKEAQSERDSAIRDAQAHIVSLNEAGKFTAQMASELAKAQARVKELRSALEKCRDSLVPFGCETCNGTHKFKFECASCLSGEGSCTCDKQVDEPCPQCQLENGGMYYNREVALAEATSTLERKDGE